MTQTVISGRSVSATVSSEGKFGWCGLDGLTHEDRPISWLLSPALTLEHYLGIPSESLEHIQYEPCESPKYLGDIVENGCTLHSALFTAAVQQSGMLDLVSHDTSTLYRRASKGPNKA